MLYEVITIKNTTKKIGKLERILIRQLRYYKGDFAVQAFNPFRLKWLKNNFPKVPRGQLITHHSDKNKFIRLIKNLCDKPVVWNLLSKPQFISYDS